MAGIAEGHRKTLLIGLAVLLGLTLLTLVFLVWPALEWYLSPVFDPGADLSITQRRNLVQGLASVAQALAVFLAGTVGLIGLYFTWRNLRQAQESSQETLRLTEQGQITERFTRAVEMLGSEHLEVRLGAIHALGRIARDSDRDHWPIMSVLTAYLREQTLRDAERSTITPEKPPSLRHMYPETTEGQSTQGIDVVIPYSDKQAVGAVIRHRSRYYGNGEDEPLDLAAVDLQAVNFQGAHLEQAMLIGTDLSLTCLTEAHLQEASLMQANLKGANLEGANLEGAFLHGADLRDTRGLTQENIEQAKGDSRTRLPEGLNRPASWTKRPEEQPNGDE